MARKARARLLELEPAFLKGLAPGAEVVVKAGFPTDDSSTEWMWFVVSAWESGTLRGNLLNQPRGIKALKLGSPVQVKLEQVGDYIYRPGDGTSEGGESSRILQARETQ
ncbi:MAG: DUF2314 domain-containing protein [Myxococcaceae bacterium]|nr:DUF2314 domain-containing protein [Myxococcaceae bacterium]MCI0669257.1 DUF2314 domain-containing protein [Myxococcaceae bacterium]